jgi:hypothetical protein
VGTPDRIRSATAAAAALTGILAGIASFLGTFVRGDGTYVTVTSVRGETYEMATTGVYANNALRVVAEGVGWDVFTLALAAPVMLLASWSVARGSFRGQLVAAGLFGYFAYMYLEYAVTWAFGPLFPLFVAILAVTVAGLVGTAALLTAHGLEGRFEERFPRRAWAALSVGMALLLVALWAARIAESLAASVPALDGETTMTVQALDLGLVVPVTLVIAIAALARSPIGLASAAAFSITFVAMSAAIVSMMVSASIATDVIQLPPIVIFGLAAVAGAAVGARIYSSVLPGAGHGAARGARPADLPAVG